MNDRRSKNALRDRLCLQCLQARPGHALIKGTWYDWSGSRIEAGEVSLEDILCAERVLKSGELVLIVSDEDVFWNPPQDPYFNPYAPGMYWLTEKAAYAVLQGAVYVVDHTGSHEDQEPTELRVTSNRLPAAYLSPGSLRDKISALSAA